ncbi:MAG TPA: hypothetical protein DEF00_04355 [Candidatus Taylorbacteria bacterium]|nr:hypothetical protein [Candidatus Taylorbacteria bacterium]
MMSMRIAKNDNVIYLLVGPRASGKSHYIQRLSAEQPGISVVSRDEILIRHFGSTDTSPYDGSHRFVRDIMYRLLRRKLSTRTGMRLVLETWTGDSMDRYKVMSRLREYGATRIVALYLVTPVECVKKWFWLKPGIARIGEMSHRQGQNLTFYSEDAPAHDYALYHKLALGIDSEGFDQVVRVNPTGPLVILE